MKKQIKTALYIRVSSEEQKRKGYSLQAQKERLLDYCKENNYKPVGLYADEGKSARSKLKNRTSLQKLIQDAQKQKFDRIVFWRLDRWFRNVPDYYKIQEILDKSHVDWECSDEEYNTTTANGRLYLNIKLSIAQNESDQTSDRIKFNFDNMVKNGRAIVGKQGLPLGYKVGGKEKNKKIVKDKNEEEIVTDMFENIKFTRSIRKTLLYINDKYNLSICYDSLRHYLKNPLYIGTYRQNQNYCEPYITKQEFKDIQHIITHNVKQNSKHDYIFSSLIICKQCGRKFTGSPHISTRINAFGEKKKYKSFSYHCQKAINEKRCPNTKFIFETVVEKKLFKQIEDNIKQFKIEYKNIEQKNKDEKINISKIKLKLDKLNELYIDGRITKDK